MTRSTGFCPHCDEPIPPEPEQWSWLPPWQCTQCEGLFGYGESGTYRIEANIEPMRPLYSWREAQRFGYYAGKRTYVYALCYPTGLPFYIGKGVNQRVCQHHADAYRESGPGSEKERLLVSLQERGESEWYHFIALCEDPAEAYQIEQALIAKLGLRDNGGLLCNKARSTSSPSFIESETPDVPVCKKPARRVHLPEGWIERPSGNYFKCLCPTCNEQCMVPDEVGMLAVACPNCAHYFRPATDLKVKSAPCFYKHWMM